MALPLHPEFADEPYAVVDAHADPEQADDSSPPGESESRSMWETEPEWETGLLLVRPRRSQAPNWSRTPSRKTARRGMRGSRGRRRRRRSPWLGYRRRSRPRSRSPFWSRRPQRAPNAGPGPQSDGGPAHARTRKNREGTERSRVFTATVVLACLVLVAVAATLVVRSLHHATPATTNPPTRSASPVSPSGDTARIQTATDEVDAATTAAQKGIASMTNFPTPANVATIINPYIASLQLYEAVLSGNTVPPTATSEAATAEALTRQDLTFLDTIDGLPPVELGAYLGQVGADTTQLQATLSDLQQSLRASAP